MDIHPTWVNNSKAIENINLNFFEKSYIVRHYMMSTVKGMSMGDFLKMAEQVDINTFNKFYSILYRSGMFCAADLLDIKSAAQLYNVIQCVKLFNLKSPIQVIEVGGGIGNLSRLFAELDVCDTYTIYDLNNVIKIQKHYLQQNLTKRKFDKIKFIAVDLIDINDIKPISTDLFISTFALTECPKTTIELYFQKLIINAQYCYILGQELYGNYYPSKDIVNKLMTAFSQIIIRDYPYFNQKAYEIICLKD
ncbi:MAG: putative sugar O-methyltransferase [Clostridia bacterium]